MTRWINLWCLLFLLTSCAQRSASTPATATLDPDWETYVDENGRFAIEFHRSDPPQAFQQSSLIDGRETIVYGVQASYYENERQAVTYFAHPGLISGTLTAVTYLDTFDINRFSSGARLENVLESNLQLGVHPGREWIFQLTDEGVTELTMHIRVYVVGTAVYQLTFGSLSRVTEETAARFFSSFTLFP